MSAAFHTTGKMQLVIAAFKLGASMVINWTGKIFNIRCRGLSVVISFISSYFIVFYPT